MHRFNTITYARVRTDESMDLTTTVIDDDPYIYIRELNAHSAHSAHRYVLIFACEATEEEFELAKDD